MMNFFNASYITTVRFLCNGVNNNRWSLATKYPTKLYIIRCLKKWWSDVPIVELFQIQVVKLNQTIVKKGAVFSEFWMDLNEIIQNKTDANNWYNILSVRFMESSNGS